MNVTKTLASQLDKSICDGFGCSETAITEITVNAGQLGTVNLYLCEKCIPKFGKSIINKNNHLSESRVQTSHIRMGDPNEYIMLESNK
jgi:hypothetical protein